VPRAIYNLPARNQAMQRLAGGEPLERAAPDCRHPDRIADASTIRRWLRRRIESLRFFLSPTLLAWDWRAAAGILIGESAPP
jgi:hypothetical protein